MTFDLGKTKRTAKAHFVRTGISICTLSPEVNPPASFKKYFPGGTSKTKFPLPVTPGFKLVRDTLSSGLISYSLPVSSRSFAGGSILDDVSLFRKLKSTTRNLAFAIRRRYPPSIGKLSSHFALSHRYAQ
jgi:hypothetical protein